MGVPRQASPEFARIYDSPNPPHSPAAGSASPASPAETKPVLSPRRQEEGWCGSYLGGLDVFARDIILCVSRLYDKPTKMAGILLDKEHVNLYNFDQTS
jgi:hypothetical protein